MADTDATTIALPTGATVDVPPAFWTAFDLAVANSCDLEDPAAARAAFGRELLVHLFALELLLVPRAFRKSSESVNLNIYTQALFTKHAAEARLHQAVETFKAGPERGDLHAEIEAAVMALTGHAPPQGLGRLAQIDERLRALRQILLGVDLDVPAEIVIEPPVDVVAR